MEKKATELEHQSSLMGRGEVGEQPAIFLITFSNNLFHVSIFIICLQLNSRLACLGLHPIIIGIETGSYCAVINVQSRILLQTVLDLYLST